MILRQYNIKVRWYEPPRSNVLFGGVFERSSIGNITDPVLVGKLEEGYRPQNPCLVTVSLGLPYRPRGWEGDEPCWKLIAGVIELGDIDLILIEMERIGWSLEDGRRYLQKKYGKVSRSQLSAEQITEFLSYLKTIASV